jgi:hypothetical protein
MGPKAKEPWPQRAGLHSPQFRPLGQLFNDLIHTVREKGVLALSLAR